MISQEGRFSKFGEEIDQITFSARVATAGTQEVRYVQETYYSSVRRYTADAFERLKLAQELEKHNVDPETVDPI